MFNIPIHITFSPIKLYFFFHRKLKMYEEQELTMQVMSEFDTTQVNGAPPPGQGPSVTVDAEWTPDRRSSIDLSQVCSADSLVFFI